MRGRIHLLRMTARPPLALLPMLLAPLQPACGGGPEPRTAAPAEPSIAVRAPRMVNVRTGRMIEDAVVVVVGQRIAAAGPVASTPLPAGRARSSCAT